MAKDLIKLIDELRRLPSETEWCEFKLNDETPERIGEYISALANSASVHQMNEAYLIFGIEDGTHQVKGTSFNPRIKGKGAEDLEPWLHRNLKPVTEFKIQEVSHPEGRVVIFFIQPSSYGPVKFLDKAWIRIGSSKKSLAEFTEKEAVIWDRRTPFEDKIATEPVTENDVIALLDYDQYFTLTGIVRPKNQTGIVEKFCEEGFLIKRKGSIHVSNLGAILLARNLDQFSKLKNKAVRIITYKGVNRLYSNKDKTFNLGYAVGFERVLSYVQSQLPELESIESALRVTKIIYPEKSIREFVANALVHQDFLISGSSPLIEIFENRIEISNPGRALIPTDRFIDHAPKSRNEKLSDMLRRMKICEKRGSGVDRAIFAIEVSQLPPPKIEDQENDGVRVTIYSYKELAKLTKEEQCRACYFHSCIQHVIQQDGLTNASLCKRLGIEEQNKAIASRIIKKTLQLGLIKNYDPANTSNRYRKYLPYWA